MLHMLSAVTLGPAVAPEAFYSAVAELTAYLEQQKLIASTSAIGRRVKHPVMDTDAADLHFFFTISFDTQEQLEASVEYMTGQRGTGAHLHEKLWSQLSDYRFTCWED